jgi:uncharacterized protein involved in response to NO
MVLPAGSVQRSFFIRASDECRLLLACDVGSLTSDMLNVLVRTGMIHSGSSKYRYSLILYVLYIETHAWDWIRSDAYR